MRRIRCTPAMLWTVLGGSALAGGISRTLELTDHSSTLADVASTAYEPIYLVANAMALYFGKRISSDHHAGSTMRLAWLLVAASCLVAIVRHSFEWVTFLLGWHRTARLITVVSLRQIPTVLAMMLLTAGLIVMWSSFAAIGLGMRFHLRELVLPLMILALVAAVLPYRGELWDDRSVYPLMRYLQWSRPVVLALPALIGLALQHISREMGRSQFADFLRCLVWSLLLRLASLLITFAPPLKDVPLLAIAGTAAFWAAPWLFVLALVHRWRMTESLSELADLYAHDPERGLAMSVTGPGLFHAGLQGDPSVGEQG